MTSESELMREQRRPGMEEQSQRELPFQRIGNYDLEKPIDVGGMGEVYLARQRTAFGRKVAIKIIRADLMHDLVARARFLREAEVSADLKHGHILPLYEFGEEDGRLFLVTPYIEGGTLARRLQHGSLSPEEIYQLFTALVQAVAYIHSENVIHRDLKPTNILLDKEDGQLYVRLIDFGIATLRGRVASPPLTTAGTEMGTIAYMAPERLSGVSAPSNDIYSLGIILYQLLTGHLPTVEQHVKLPQSLRYLIHRCIAPNPDARFASADELLYAFEQVYPQLKDSSSMPPTDPTPPPAPASLMEEPSIPVFERITGEAPRPTEDQTAPTMEPLLALWPSDEVPVASIRLPSVPLKPSSQPHVSTAFAHEDYSAPTTSIGPAASPPVSGKRPTVAKSAVVSKPLRPKKRQRSLMLILFLLILMLVVVIGSLAFSLFQGVIIPPLAVTVQFAPQTHLVSEVFSITANPTAQAPNPGSRVIAAKVLSSSKSGTQSGPTTGQTNCFLGFLNCQPSVNDSDVSTVAGQIRPTLIAQLALGLRAQLKSLNAQQVGSFHFGDQSLVADPPVGQPGKTVTVTLKEQGGVEYFVGADAQTLAQQLLTQKALALGAGFALLSPTIRIGEPVVQAVDNINGIVTIKIAAAGIAQYTFPPSQLSSIDTALKGKTLNAAHAYLLNQPGMDATTIVIHFTTGGGNTLPDDVQHIKIIPLNPTTLPAVTLPTAMTPTTPTGLPS